MQRCGTSDLSENDKTFAARLRVLKKARDFERSVESTFVNLAQRMERLYSQVKSHDENEWARVSTLMAARIVERRPNIPILHLFAVHKHLMAKNTEFVIRAASSMQLQEFDVRPLSHIKKMNLVIDWVKTKNPTLTSFAEKATAIVDISRKLIVDSKGQMPSPAMINTPSFSDNDRAILFFLDQYIQYTPPIYKSPFDAFAPSIMKMIPRYNDPSITTAVVQRFLTEIGVRAPWQDMIPEDRRFEVYKKSEPSLLDNIVPERLEIPPVQSIERFDFGDTPVYVVDDEGAKELDDGVSYEAIPDDPSSGWVHVHIADPTALVKPNDTIAQRARARMETVYFTLDTYSMLPEDIVNNGMSLGSTPHSDKGQNVLTFSCRINSNGDITEYKVRAGLVKNVVILKYSEVDAIIGGNDQNHIFYPFSASVSESKPDVGHLLAHKDNLTTLFALSQRQVKARSLLPIFGWSQPHANVSITPSNLPKLTVDVDAPRLFRGFPAMKYSVTDYLHMESGARSMVAEFMKSACRVASRFCNEHNIPAIRRSVGEIQATEEDIRDLLAKRNEHNFVEAVDVWKAGIKIGEGTYTLKPAQHWILGIPEGEGYVRVTSPLRRFQDMVMHWQIKHALADPLTRTAFPFNKEFLLHFIHEIKRFDTVIKRGVSNQGRYWPRLYIGRVLDGLEVLPEERRNILNDLEAYTVGLCRPNNQLGRFETDIFIPHLGLSATLVTDYNSPWTVGHRLKVRVYYAQLGTRSSILADVVKESI